MAEKLSECGPEVAEVREGGNSCRQFARRVRLGIHRVQGHRGWTDNRVHTVPRSTDWLSPRAAVLSSRRRVSAFGRSSVDRLVGQSDGRAVGRLVDRLVGRSVVRSDGESIDRSARVVGRSVCRSVDFGQPVGRLSGRSFHVWRFSAFTSCIAISMLINCRLPATAST